MKSLTALFIRLNFEYKHYIGGCQYSECATKYLGNLRYSEGVINPLDIDKSIFEGLKYFSYSSTEFVQPCFSTELSVEELLARIVQERGGMRYYYTYEKGLIRKYAPYANTHEEVGVIYPWMIHNKKAYKEFKKLSKLGTFVLGISNWSYGDYFRFK